MNIWDPFVTLGGNFYFDTFKNDTFKNDTFESAYVDRHPLYYIQYTYILMCTSVLIWGKIVNCHRGCFH